jgi:hypothetical protein
MGVGSANGTLFLEKKGRLELEKCLGILNAAERSWRALMRPKTMLRVKIAASIGLNMNEEDPGIPPSLAVEDAGRSTLFEEAPLAARASPGREEVRRKRAEKNFRLDVCKLKGICYPKGREGDGGETSARVGSDVTEGFKRHEGVTTPTYCR